MGGRVRIFVLFLAAASFSLTLAPGCERAEDPGANEAEEGAAVIAGEVSAEPLSLDEARAYNLEKLNLYRAQAGLAPLVMDPALNVFAQAASEQLSRDHVPHLYFRSNSRACKCDLAAENQGSPHGWYPRDVRHQIDSILFKMMQSAGHRKNMLNPAHRRVGIGLVRPGADLYFTNDFGR